MRLTENAKHVPAASATHGPSAQPRLLRARRMVIQANGISDPNAFFTALVAKPYVGNVVISPHYYPPSISQNSAGCARSCQARHAHAAGGAHQRARAHAASPARRCGRACTTGSAT